MTIIPPYLKKGDTIGLVCPAGYMSEEKAATCIETLQAWGFKVKVGKTLGTRSNYFSGTDEERLHDLQEMLDDGDVSAVLCGRGGYGTSRIIDQVNFKKFKRRPKWIIGFSDITVLHTHILARYNIAGLHAPMAAAFNDGGSTEIYVQSLLHALKGKRATYTCDAHAYNKPGTVVAQLTGGNLSLLTHLMSTPSEVKTKNCILFIEDVGEYIYNIDRMLLQLKRSGKLRHLAALIVGGFTDEKDTVTPYGSSTIDVIHNAVKEYDFPVCFNFPVSHEKENYALKVGATYKLSVQKNKVTLAEQTVEAGY